MKTEYEILLWSGSDYELAEVWPFDLADADQALKQFHWMIANQKQWPAPYSADIPYLSIKRYTSDFEEHLEFGNGCNGFDGDFNQLPKYVQRKCKHLIALEMNPNK